MSKGTRVEISEDVACEQLDGETVVLNPTSGVYFSLNASGTVVWDALVRYRDTALAETELARQFNITEAQARVDVQELTAQLCDAGLLRRDEDRA